MVDWLHSAAIAAATGSFILVGVASLIRRKRYRRRLRLLETSFQISCVELAQSQGLKAVVGIWIEESERTVGVNSQIELMGQIPSFVRSTESYADFDELFTLLPPAERSLINTAVEDGGLRIEEGIVSAKMKLQFERLGAPPLWRSSALEEGHGELLQMQDHLDALRDKTIAIASALSGLRDQAAPWLLKNIDALGHKRVLRVLQMHYPDHLATARACRQGVEHPDPNIRIEAALGISQEQTLVTASELDVATVAADSWLHALSRLSIDEEVTALLNRLWVVRDANLLREVTRLMRVNGAIADFELLAKLVAHGAEPAVSAAWVTALTETDDGRAATLLCQLLQTEQAGKSRGLVLTAIVDALGFIGTIEAVPLLRLLGEQLQAWRGEAAQDIQWAIERIQSRVAGEQRGNLALADAAAERGALSLTEADGQLALAASDQDDGDSG